MIEIYGLTQTLHSFDVVYTINEQSESQRIKFTDLKQHVTDYGLCDTDFKEWLNDNKETAILHYLTNQN
jgi:hypothetical protein